MKKLTLPFYNEFFQIFENNQILNWRASDFIRVILDDSNSFYNKEKNQVYRALNILVECRYLKRERLDDNKKIYFYSETIRLKVYKEKAQFLKIKDILVRERRSIEKSLTQHRVEYNFIHDIVHKHPELEVFFEKYGMCISKRIEEMETKMVFLKSVLNDIDT